ncbi:MAG: hypothetical protein N3B10_09565 [Armatimonadetes bacterium]|nr:hypothetical protein [Armatimonadota bacterium]
MTERTQNVASGSTQRFCCFSSAESRRYIVFAIHLEDAECSVGVNPTLFCFSSAESRRYIVFATNLEGAECSVGVNPTLLLFFVG